MILPLGLAYAGKMGSGDQYYPWIHVDDIAHLFTYCVEHNVSGIVNGVASRKQPIPNILLYTYYGTDAVTNGEFAKILGKIGGKFTIPVPDIVVRTMFGDRAFMILVRSRYHSCIVF